MLRLRPYKDEDVPIILSWCHKEKDFYKWTAGVMGDYKKWPAKRMIHSRYSMKSGSGLLWK